MVLTLWHWQNTTVSIIISNIINTISDYVDIQSFFWHYKSMNYAHPRTNHHQTPVTARTPDSIWFLYHRHIADTYHTNPRDQNPWYSSPRVTPQSLGLFLTRKINKAVFQKNHQSNRLSIHADSQEMKSALTIYCIFLYYLKLSLIGI